MTSLTEIETAIKSLPEEEARKLSVWLQEYVADQWDNQIAADFASGKLDRLIAAAEADITANRVKGLNEILRNN